MVLSSQSAAADLLEKRSAIYSGSPCFAVHDLYAYTFELTPHLVPEA